ncbi:hypothetical protein BDZ94DRAFT_1311630 [Collybia nuda]|uniref:Uncharacterized protein n=1 Tax=Collybia nuda TaxID=64659 RepID=A0A9P5Y0T0_9AGAR|nr:hypothetical protein BDZ94DRAFT_1311630 [Collybia nuda]
MYLIFENFSMECRISFELMTFIGLAVVVNLLAFACTVRRLHEKIDKILDGHATVRAQDHPPKLTRSPPSKERTAIRVCAPSTQRATLGGVRLHAVLDKLPAHLVAVITSSTERLSAELSSTKALETALNEIYPSEHTDEVFEKLAETMFKDITPSLQHIVDCMVIKVMVRCSALWVENICQRAGKDAEDARKAGVESIRANEAVDRLCARLGKDHPAPQGSTNTTTAVPMYKDLFDTPNAWSIKS